LAKRKQKSETLIRKEHDRKVLEIYEGDTRLSKSDVLNIVHNITDADIALLACQQPDEIKGVCEYTGWYVGKGTCLAQKYNKYGIATQSRKCQGCRSNEIVNQLNYILKHKYEGKYCAKWREKSIYRKRRKS